MAKQDLYQHFRPEERAFIEKIDDLARRVEDTYAFHLTEFLNPRQVAILKSVVGNRGLNYFCSADYYPSEYARILIVPDYYEFQPDDFDLSLLEINYNAKFNQLTHAQIMGALINRLGIRRELIGDILVEAGYAQLLVDVSMESYFIDNISKIGKASVQLKKIPLGQLIENHQKSQSMDVLVSSMRLDKILATVLNLSRSQALQLIATEKVKVNYQTFTKGSEMLALEDLISVRGFGRFSLAADNGFSKNGKHKLTIDKMTHK